MNEEMCCILEAVLHAVAPGELTVFATLNGRTGCARLAWSGDRGMRAIALALGLLAMPRTTALGQPLPERFWIAGRYDSTRVVIYFDSGTFHGTIPARARTLAAPAAVLPFKTRVLPAGYIARLPREPQAEHFAIGDRYDLLLSGGRVITVTLTALVGFESDEHVGNASYIGALGSVAKDDVRYLVKHPYYVARPHVHRTPSAAATRADRRPAAAGLVDDSVPADIRQRVAALLRERLRADEDSTVRATVQTVPLVLETVQPFRLADGALRHYVQARMEVAGTVCWMMAAWLMPPPAASLMAGAAEYCMSDGAHDTPALLNVVTLGRGRTGLIVFIPEGDGWSYELVEYRDGVGLNKMRVLRRLSFGE